MYSCKKSRGRFFRFWANFFRRYLGLSENQRVHPLFVCFITFLWPWVKKYITSSPRFEFNPPVPPRVKESANLIIKTATRRVLSLKVIATVVNSFQLNDLIYLVSIQIDKKWCFGFFVVVFIDSVSENVFDKNCKGHWKILHTGRRLF